MDILERWRKKMYEPTSGSDLQRLLSNRGIPVPNIVRYDEISKYESLDDLLGPTKSVLILYPNRDESGVHQDVGHWITVFKSEKSGLNYFDSYGGYVDDDGDGKDTGYGRRGKIDDYLSKLIEKDPEAKTFYYNDYPMQDEEDMDISTCGLWTVLRLIEKDKTDEEFADLYYKTPLERDVLPDLAVASLFVND